MNVQDVIAEVKQISWIAASDDAAHAREDALYVKVLQAIAHGELRGSTARECAAEALKASEIEFSRWYS
jgi:hypothetical protein